MPLPRHLPLGRRLSFSLPPPRPSSSATATATHPRERRWVTTLSVCVAHTFEALLDKHWSTQFLFLLLLLLPSPFPPFLLTFCNRRLSSLSLSSSACLKLFSTQEKRFVVNSSSSYLSEVLSSSLLAHTVFRTEIWRRKEEGGRRRSRRGAERNCQFLSSTSSLSFCIAR